MLNLSEKQIRRTRAHFRGYFSEGLEVVLCGHSCTDGGRVGGVKRAEHAESLRWMALADFGPDPNGIKLRAI